MVGWGAEFYDDSVFGSGLIIWGQNKVIKVVKIRFNRNIQDMNIKSKKNQFRFWKIEQIELNWSFKVESGSNTL